METETAYAVPAEYIIDLQEVRVTMAIAAIMHVKSTFYPSISLERNVPLLFCRKFWHGKPETSST